MNVPWTGVLDFCLLGACLLAATLIRANIKFVQKFMVPNNIIAGFICFALGGDALGLFNIPAERFGAYVYHLLAITFIAMALRKAESAKGVNALSTGFIMAVGISLQAFIGLAIAMIFFLTIMPDTFPTFGYFLMLGFSQGPGQAYALGKTWEPLGFADAGNIGLTFAAIGYIWACIAGVGIIYFALKKRKLGYSERIDSISQSDRTGFASEAEMQEAGRLTTTSSAVESLAFHLGVVGVVYLVTFGLLKGIELLLISDSTGDMIRHLVNTMWGIHFIFAAWLAILLRNIIGRFGKGYLLDSGLLTRISGTSLDFMVTAAIAAISFQVFLKHSILILTMSTLGGVLTALFVIKIVPISRMSHPLERIASIYGTLTGTLSTGLTLNRIVDPSFESPAPQALLFGTAVTLPLAIPIIFSSFIPIYGMDQPNPWLYYLGAVLFTGVYTFVIYLIWRWLIAGRKSKRI